MTNTLRKIRAGRTALRASTTHEGNRTMMARIRRTLSFANVASTLALVIALSTGGAYAAGYVISSNQQVAPNTISGHKAPAGDQPNIIPGSLTAADLAAPEAWHTVAVATSQTDPCAATPAAVATFCGYPGDTSWGNVGGAFAPAAYTRDLQGFIKVRGLVSVWDCHNPALNGSGGYRIFLLPSGYRPAHELVFTALDNNRSGSYLVRLDVSPDGVIQLYNDMAPGVYGQPCGQFLSLDGISFRAGE